MESCSVVEPPVFLECGIAEVAVFVADFAPVQVGDVPVEEAEIGGLIGVAVRDAAPLVVPETFHAVHREKRRITRSIGRIIGRAVNGGVHEVDFIDRPADFSKLDRVIVPVERLMIVAAVGGIEQYIFGRTAQ